MPASRHRFVFHWEDNRDQDHNSQINSYSAPPRRHCWRLRPRLRPRASAPGLITKTETNPFFVKMHEGAEAKAKELGVDLQRYAGKFDGDNDGQVAAIENLIVGRRQGLRHRAERFQGDRADHQEGA